MIGGNKTAKLQKATYSPNSIGEMEASWEDYLVMTGYLDLMGSTATYQSIQAKVEEATHVWIMDWVDIQETDPAMLRFVMDGHYYNVLYIDDPMGKGRQVEIYLKRMELTDV